MSVATMQRETAFQVRSLFRSLLRQSSQFSNYNFRDYARRKTRDSFREHKGETEERRIQELIQDGLQNLRLLKRQTIISQFYQMDKLVVEGQKTGKETGDSGDIVRQKDTGASRSGRHLDTSNRSRTGQIDHDVFEGIPVRRWSRQPHLVSQVPKVDESEQGDVAGGKNALPELPMPRDSQLLPAMSRALLRAARAGCIYIRPTGRASEDEKKETADGRSRLRQYIFQIAASQVGSGRLSQNTWNPPSAEGGSMPGPMRKTKIKRTDPETGNISIYEVWVPEGHRIEGEITVDVQTIAEQSAVPVTAETPAPGTVVEGVGVVNAEGVVVAEAGSASVMTPPKRRPPPPKRKGRGIGKGRKKKVMFAPGEGADAATVHGVPPVDATVAGVKAAEDTSRTSVDPSVQDEDEEGEEGEDSDEGDESMLDAKTPETPQAPPGVDTEISEYPAPISGEPANDVEMRDATADIETPGPDPIVGEGTVKQQVDITSVAPTETPQPDRNASAVPPTSPPSNPSAAETRSENKSPDQGPLPTSPAPAESGAADGPSLNEPSPKQEPKGSEPPADEKLPSKSIETAQIQVKTESTPQPVAADDSALKSASPARPEENQAERRLQSEPDQQLHEVPSADTEAAPTEPSHSKMQDSPIEAESTPVPEIEQSSEAVDVSDVPPVEAEASADVEMSDAAQEEEPVTAEPVPKPPSPLPAMPGELKSEPEQEAEPKPQSPPQVDQIPARSTESPALETGTPEVPEPTAPETTSVPEIKSEEALPPDGTSAVDDNTTVQSDSTPTLPPAPVDELASADQTAGEQTTTQTTKEETGSASGSPTQS
ncbi:hypothetical protein POX_g09055 [Penicillium oxalicum]|uniref:hypothetical protein n=1 Tax=Penicillium oxalicum TaxID=69781 RepID=UPI0020B63DAB|nr:hypothetical protein POX_g09055 [Penicillium oxalicum]KAI2786667.1 hypothetical protein POX_g09055 [Penicillium oxalicum]